MRAEVGATWLIGSTRGGNDVKTLSVHQWHSDGVGSGLRGMVLLFRRRNMGAIWAFFTGSPRWRRDTASSLSKTRRACVKRVVFAHCAARNLPGHVNECTRTIWMSDASDQPASPGRVAPARGDPRERGDDQNRCTFAWGYGTYLLGAAFNFASKIGGLHGCPVVAVWRRRPEGPGAS
jgi:hypothetical protein